MIANATFCGPLGRSSRSCEDDHQNLFQTFPKKREKSLKCGFGSFLAASRLI
jgi:hypothetical protein